MNKDDTTWLNIGYVVFALIVAYVGYKFIETVGVQMSWVERYDEWYPYLQTFGSIVCGAAGFMIIRGKKDRYDYHLAAIGELRKVSWPTWPDTKRMTIIVCVVVGVFAVILAIFDVIWSRALELLLT